MPSFQDYVDVVKSYYAQRILKIEVLDSDENVTDTIEPDLLGGDLQLSSESGARRNCTLQLDNSDSTYTPDPDGLFWIDTKYRIYTGYKVLGEDYFVSRGIFVSGEPQVNSNGAEQTVDMQLYDKWLLYNGELGGTLENEYIINVGTDITTAVQQIFADAGEVKTPIIEPTSEVTPYTIVESAGSTYADILLKLADMLSWVVYFDKDGYPRFEPPTDIESAGSSWDFTTEEVNYLGSNHRYEYTKIKNNVICVGANILGSIVRETASDTNPLSPTSIANIGKKTLVIEDDLINTSELCQGRADYELQKAISLIETVNLQSIPIDTLEGDFIVSVYDTASDLNADRFLIKNISFPLMNDGESTLSVWKTRTLS